MLVLSDIDKLEKRSQFISQAQFLALAPIGIAAYKTLTLGFSPLEAVLGTIGVVGTLIGKFAQNYTTHQIQQKQLHVFQKIAPSASDIQNFQHIIKAENHHDKKLFLAIGSVLVGGFSSAVVYQGGQPQHTLIAATTAVVGILAGMAFDKGNKYEELQNGRKNSFKSLVENYQNQQKQPISQQTIAPSLK